MSEIKVNKISPRTNCGTTTLGDSGDTFTIPAGVSITNNGTASGFGATGAVSWNTTVKTGDFTAVSGEGYFVNTTSGAITVTLPSSPSAGAVVGFKDYAKTWDTNNCTLNRNSEKIGGDANNAILSTEGLAVTLVYVDSTQGWLITDDGLQSNADTNPYMVATGGTITTTGNCKIHTFTGPGTFTVCKVAVCAADNLVSYVVVAGGGGGGNAGGGGGGAGGFREVVSPSSPYTGSPLNGYPTPGNRITVTATAFPITVGAGAPGATQPSPTTSAPDGANSIFSTITSAGGSGGGAGPQCTATIPAGGSGGGGRANQANSGAAGNTPPTTPAQGTPGGTGGPANGGGGGGGATDPGTNAAGRFGGCGGDGASSEITGSAVVRGGGGGGGSDQGGPTPGSPGTGGQAGPGGGGKGGNGQPLGAPGAGFNGTDNTGGGGGGGTNAPAFSPNNSAGGNGGSGVVIIRYRYQ
jgi:hypothetical protein